MKKVQLMAADEATLKLATGMWVERDFEAMAELHMLGRLNISDGTEKVAQVKVHMFSGKMEVRKKGSAKIWWVSIDALQRDNPKMAEEKPKVEEYDPAATEAQYLREFGEILSKNKKMAKLGPKIAADQARKLIDLGKALEKEGEVVDAQYWRAAKVWLEMGFSPKVTGDLMPVFADTLLGEKRSRW
jgi:hypothetical protein